MDKKTAQAWGDRQKQLILDTYDQAWQTGVDNYQPNPGSDKSHIELRDDAAAAVAGAVVLPTVVDEARRAQAVSGALNGIDSMVGELAVLDLASVGGWADQNGWRLDAGESVAWAGEQAGFGEAADSAGDLLDWQDVGDDSECQDCQDLGGLGPMPLSDWPTTPGSGDTECNAGCRCSWETVPLLPGDQFLPPDESGQAVIDGVASQAADRMDSLAGTGG